MKKQKKDEQEPLLEHPTCPVCGSSTTVNVKMAPGVELEPIVVFICDPNGCGAEWSYKQQCERLSWRRILSIVRRSVPRSTAKDIAEKVETSPDDTINVLMCLPADCTRMEIDAFVDAGRQAIMELRSGRNVDIRRCN